MNLTFNLDASGNRAWSSGSTNASNYTVSLTALENNKLKFRFLSSQDSDIIANLNTLPHTEYQRYITNLPQVNAGTSLTVPSNALQLSQIPNKIYIVVRKPLNQCTVADSNSFFGIEGLSINFNNLNGILSGSSAVDLYELSKKNGSKQDLYEFLGSSSTWCAWY